MGCAASTSNMQKVLSDSDGPLDLDLLVEEYSKYLYKKTKPIGSPSLGKVHFQVDWKKMKIQSKKPTYGTSVSDNASPRTLQIYTSVQENKTDLEQEYTVSDTRKTTSSAVVKVKQGLTVSGQDVKLELPNEKDSPKLKNSSLPKSMTICKADGVEEVKEEITWTIGSKIRAKERSKVKIEMSVKEIQYSTGFTMTSVLKGKITINVLRKDNNKQITNMHGMIHEIIAFAKDRGLAETWSIEGTKAICTIKGNLLMRFQVEKRETATEMTLDEEDSDYCTDTTHSTQRRPSNASSSRRSTIASSSGVQVHENRSYNINE